MFKEFTQGLRRGFHEGYYGKPYVETPPTSGTYKVAKFLGAWQNVTDHSQQQAQEIMRDPTWSKHFRALNWVITLVVIAYIGSAFFN